MGGDACLSVEAEGHNGRSNEAKSRPECEPASGRDRRGGLAGPKDHSAEADASLHAANPLLCPAKKGGRHRGKEISEEGGGRGFVPEFVPGFVPFENSTSTTSTILDLPASSRIDESTCAPIKNVR